MKATGFRSLRINCWNITQVIWIYKIFSSTLTSYYIQINDIKHPPLISSWECTDFSKQHKQAPEVLHKKGVLKNFTNIHKKTPPLERLCVFRVNFIKKRLRHRYFPLNIVKFLRTPILKNIWERLHPKELF